MERLHIDNVILSAPDATALGNEGSQYEILPQAAMPPRSFGRPHDDKFSNNYHGFSLIEVLLAVTIFAIFSSGVFYVSMDSTSMDMKIDLDNQALLYAEEGLEAVRNMRDRSYLSMTNGDHGLAFSGDAWSFIQAPEIIDEFFARTVVVSDVYRDTNGNIADSGTYDPETKKVVSRVEWTFREVIPRSIELVMYLSNWSGDDWVETTCSELDGGEFTDTETIPADSPPADNCDVRLAYQEEASPFFSSADLGEHGWDVFVDGSYAYVANNKTNRGFSVADVSDPSAPFVVRDLDIGGKGNAVTKQGNYAYVGVEKASKGLAIVNVSNPVAATTVNVGDKGTAVAASGNYLYVGTYADSNSFRIFNISNPASPLSVKTLNFNKVQAIAIDGNYAYVGLYDDTNSFRVVDIATPSSASAIASLDVDEEVNAIAISGFFAFVGTDDDEDSLRIVNIATPSNPSQVVSLDVDGAIEGLSVAGDYLYVALDQQNAGLAVVNISDPLNPYLAYTLDVAGNGTSVQAKDNYIYMTLNTQNDGLIIIGATVFGAETSGAYISQSFDTGSVDTRYNFIEWNETVSAGGTLELQIRTADSVASLDWAEWVGDDGTSSTSYDVSRTPLVLDPNRSGNQFFQVKAILTSDGVTSPLLESIRVNYTP